MSIVPGRDVPEVPQAWVDAVNQAINDANHEDLCSSLHTLADCDSYRPGQWDIGVDLDIAVGVLEPLIRAELAKGATTEWAVRVTSHATGRTVTEAKADESAAHHDYWGARSRNDQMARLLRREAGAWTEVADRG